MRAVAAGLMFALALAAPACAEDGVGVNARFKLGMTLLHMVAMSPDHEPSVVRMLVEAGADPNARDENGWTPLHAAAGLNPEPSVVAVIAILAEAGADPNARTEDDFTPLHAAAGLNPEPSAIKALIEAGADPAARDRWGKMPFDYAKDNEALQGTDAYWRLNDARFE